MCRAFDHSDPEVAYSSEAKVDSSLTSAVRIVFSFSSSSYS